MEMFELMNTKIDLGWKLTDANCPTCKAIVMYNPVDKSFNCLKCKCPIDLQQSHINEVKSEEQQQDDYYDDLIKNDAITKPYKPSRSDQISKKMSEKLLQGWAMLEQSCETCNVPLMKSKKGQKICYGCDKDYQKPVVQPIKEQKLESVAEMKPDCQSPVKISSTNKDVVDKIQQTKSGQELRETIDQILLKSVQFYKKRIEKNIEQNNEMLVDQSLDRISKILAIRKSNV